MTDNDLIKALYREGLTVEAIADKFDLRPIQVRKVLGVSIDPRPNKTWQRFFEVLGDAEYPVSRAAQKMGIKRETMYAYMQRFEKRGHAKSRLLTKTCRVFRMVRPEAA